MTSETLLLRLQPLMEQAVAAQQRGDFATAEARYREVLRTVPEHADATHFLGLIAHQTGHSQAASDLLYRSIVLGPGSALYRHNLGGVLRELGRHAEAEARYREALALRPGYADALIGIAMTQTARNQHENALASYRQVLELDTTNFEAQLGCGAALLELARRSEALDCYRQTRGLATGDAQRLHRLGLALREAGAAEDARDCFESALALHPDFVEAHNSLGVALGDLGDLTGAESHYREALRLRPDYVSGWHNLASIARFGTSDSTRTSLQTLTGRLAQLSPAEASMLHFTLGKVHDDAGEYATAFEHYLEGNKLKREMLEYDESRQTRFFRNFMHHFNPEFMAAGANAGPTGESPVFIIGMSRSGTTLVEQILASHPQVYGAGELHLLRRCLHAELESVTDDDELPGRLVQLEDGGFQRIGERYCSALSEFAPDAKRITDKLPGNMALVGLIHLAFPSAHIIHCTRDPLDTCVSCFSKLFTTGHAFSYELGELGRFYRLYQELMQHWRDVLPAGRMLEVRYEDVVDDMETQAHRLVEFCGLPWEDACLRFHETQRTVKTASLAQVRQPIYASSVQRWKRYEEYLAPLKRALAGG